MILARRISAGLAVVIALVGLLGHMLANVWMTSWSDGRLIHIRTTACVGLSLSGIMAMLMTTAPNSRWKEILICTFASLLAGTLTGHAIWYFNPPHQAAFTAKTVSGNVISLGMFSGLSLLSIAGWLRGVLGYASTAITVSRTAAAIGIVAIVSYLLGGSFLNWDIAGVSNPISLPAAAGLCLCAFAVNGRETT